MPAAGEEVRAEGLVIGAGEVGGEDAAGRGHAGIGGGSESESRGARGEGRRYTDGRWNADLVALGSGCSILF